MSMTVEQFVSLLNAKKVRKNRWIALCPSHGDKIRSLSIDLKPGPWKKQFVFECMSQHCSADSILKAMGLKWRDLLGEAKITPEVRQRLKDQEYLKILETRWGAYTLLAVIGWEHHDFWVYQASKTDFEICSLKAKLGLYDRTGSF